MTLCLFFILCTSESVGYDHFHACTLSTINVVGVVTVIVHSACSHGNKIDRLDGLFRYFPLNIQRYSDVAWHKLGWGLFFHKSVERLAVTTSNERSASKRVTDTGAVCASSCHKREVVLCSACAWKYEKQPLGVAAHAPPILNIGRNAWLCWLSSHMTWFLQYSIPMRFTL